MSFTIATTVAEALSAMASGARPIAGGTDLVVGARQHKGALPRDLVAIDRIPELSEIDARPNETAIGAAVTHATLMTEATVLERATAVADAAALVGSPATRNVGTLGGNVMNASPAMDTGAPLLVLGAEVDLRTTTAARSVPIADLWSGPGATTAAVDELCVGVRIPVRDRPLGSAYVRLEYRRAMEIAVVGAAAAVTVEPDGTVADVAVALTAVAPTIVPVDVTALAGRTLDASLLDDVADLAAATASPITDLRAGADYRRHMVGVMARRALSAAHRRASGDPIPVPVNRALGIGAA